MHAQPGNPEASFLARQASRAARHALRVQGDLRAAEAVAAAEAPRAQRVLRAVEARHEARPAGCSEASPSSSGQGESS